MREGSKGSIISRNYHTVYLEEEEKDDRCNNISWGEGFFRIMAFLFFLWRGTAYFGLTSFEWECPLYVSWGSGRRI